MFNRKKRKAETSTSTTASQKHIKLETEPWKLVFQDARQAFTENKFTDAVSLFTRALTLNPNQVTLLDCRAACYEKLNQLDAALRDAIAMVKRSPNDARGYLRAGKLFSLQKQFDKAVKVYANALKKVDPQDARFTLIQSIKMAAEKSLNPPAKIDPIVTLPYDVASLVFSLLSFDRRVQCTLVSRKWRNFALNWSGMWKELEFGNRKVSQGTIKKYLQYAEGRHIRLFSIHYANRNATRNILQSLIDENCQYIETLDFKGCEIPIDVFARMMRLVGKNVKHIRLDEAYMSTGQFISMIAPYCPQVTHLSLLKLMDNTVHEPLSLDQLTHIRCDANLAMSLKSNNLKSLDVFSTLVDFTTLYNQLLQNHKDLEQVHFTMSGTVEKIAWNPNVVSKHSKQKGLRTFGLYADRPFTNRHIVSFLIENPNLQHLIIEQCHVSIGEGIVEYIREHGLPQLVTLRLPRCVGLTEEGLHDIITRCPLLETVCLSMVANVSDSTLADFGANCKHLKKLDLSDCNNITGKGLGNLLQRGSSLEKLILNNCQRISPDAVNWAISQLGKGVVECKFQYK